jgi:DNA ligase-1
LRVGVADGILREAITEAFFENDKDRKDIADLIEEKFDLTNDSAIVFDSAIKGRHALEKLSITPGKPIKAMLAVKAENIEDGFRICGKPAAFEYKYDGFRVFVNKKDTKISLFTRKLENVTSQFPDVVRAVEKQIKGDNFIIDSEVVGYDKRTGKYTPFESISQRIKRKYDIDKLIEKLPVEVNVFDVLFYNGKNLMSEKFVDRRKLLEKIVKNKEKVLRISKLLITDSEKKAEEFYNESLKAGEEGVMIKRTDAPYRQGRRVGFMAKLKPSVRDLDLIITGAIYGSGKRGGLLTSYIVACKKGDEYLDIGKVSSGLKEKESEQEGSITYEEMTELLKPLIKNEKGSYVKIKPKIVVAVTYQNIQKSPSYDSGYALRFPRITNYRPDRNADDITEFKEIEKEARK